MRKALAELDHRKLNCHCAFYVWLDLYILSIQNHVIHVVVQAWNTFRIELNPASFL